MGFLNLEIIACVLIFAPLFAAAVVGLSSRVINDALSQFITCGMLIISAASATLLFKGVVLDGSLIHIALLDWISVGNFKARWAIYIDTLTAVMLIVVTYVSALVHVYSVGYMSHDECKPRFMSYLSLFTFFMLSLVTSDNFLQLFFGWEGVGVASYLLIGFWFKKDTASAAAIKAFLVNRVGDFGFALGIFMVFWYLGSIEFSGAFAAAPIISDATLHVFGYEVKVITLTCLLLFIGAMGKSAQFGLHTWLPDAMEGPTPVSALIHAATMVTAGVFMVARCSPLFEYSSVALSVVTCIGAFTCLFAASIALVQNDIKRVIAYSTCSQLGYMFFACGVSAYSAGIFHLMTHGFFKALLFLGAGSVIHAMSDEQDLRKMGGIWKKIPFTYAMMWIGSLALAGIFPFAGFYSKDTILEAAMASGTAFGESAYMVGLLAAVLTAFYSFRLIIMSFHGKPNASQKVMEHVHESPVSMTFPLLILAVGSVCIGYVGAKMLGMVDATHDFWRNSIFVMVEHNSIERIENMDHIYGHLPLLAGILGIVTAFIIYMGKPQVAYVLSMKFKNTYKFLLSKWYVDEAYDFLFVKSSKKLGRFLWRSIDMRMVDGLPNGSAAATHLFAKLTSIMQTGFIYHYSFVMMLGLVGFLSWMLFLML
ncbi:MAG: NADH-quinone oxidoreductase subunit L [Candidatus Jidaibacter sp.]|jgi:NADH-quinone oxidoreductase subunit L|nr:NADH-quinone oxidoreductase subunit L [Candidatus Jidaibacter sp.]